MITQSQAWQHGYVDGLLSREDCPHAMDPDDKIVESYGWGRVNGSKQRLRDLLKQEEEK